MLLEQYTHIDLKADFFEEGNVLVNTKSEFDDVWDRFMEFDKITDQPVCFRGCSEAKWKLYTSAQRFWIERELATIGFDFKKFIENLITRSAEWNYETVSHQLTFNGIGKDNDLAYLSYMQHHNLPTPLLDFTTNPFVALFFAFEKQANGFSSKEEIDNYCSVYAVDQRSGYLKLKTQKFEELFGADKTDGIKYEKLLDQFVFLPLGKSSDEKFKLSNNPNIANQEGLFFLNCDSRLPLESIYSDESSSLKKDIGSSDFHGRGYSDRIGTCFNIHKSLRNYFFHKIKNSLDYNRISPEYIFPDPRKMAEACLNQVLENL